MNFTEALKLKKAMRIKGSSDGFKQYGRKTTITVEMLNEQWEVKQGESCVVYSTHPDIVKYSEEMYYSLATFIDDYRDDDELFSANNTIYKFRITGTKLNQADLKEIQKEDDLYKEHN